jgi:hypothetical protein
MGFYRLLARGHTEQGETFNFSLHCQNPAGTVAGAAAAWHTALGLLWNGVAPPADSIKQLVPTSCGVDASIATELDPLTGKNLGQLQNVEALVGTEPGDPQPPQVSCCVSLRTAQANRHGRGRFYLPPFGEAQVTAGLLTGAAQGQVSVASQKMIQSLNGAGYQVGIWHKQTLTITPVVSVDVSNVLKTQRRRYNKLLGTRSSQSV